MENENGKLKYLLVLLVVVGLGAFLTHRAQEQNEARRRARIEALTELAEAAHPFGTPVEKTVTLASEEPMLRYIPAAVVVDCYKAIAIRDGAKDAPDPAAEIRVYEAFVSMVEAKYEGLARRYNYYVSTFPRRAGTGEAMPAALKSTFAQQCRL